MGNLRSHNLLGRRILFSPRGINEQSAMGNDQCGGLIKIGQTSSDESWGTISNQQQDVDIHEFARFIRKNRIIGYFVFG